MNVRVVLAALAVTLGLASASAAQAQVTCGSTGFTADEVASALTDAIEAAEVPTNGDDVEVSCEGGQFQFDVRLSDTAGGVQGSPLLLAGEVEVSEDGVKVSARVVSTETSQTVDESEGDADDATQESIAQAAETAFGRLESLSR
jgi:hypothetical protein